MAERIRELEQVGQGACSVVCRALLVGVHGVEKPVAIKRLRPELREDLASIDLFVNEARLVVRLSHPNLMGGVELGRDAQGYYLACEWLDCVSLDRVCAQEGNLSGEAVAQIGVALCEGLHYLHHLKDAEGRPLNAVHRDITPANVLLTADGKIKLADFGAAYFRGQLQVPLLAIGTPGFAAPEQGALAEQEQPEARWDLYGLGATLKSLSSDLPPPLRAVLERATAEEPEKRHQRASELGADLRAACQKAGITLKGDLSTLYAKGRECCEKQEGGEQRSLDHAVKSILGGAFASPAASPGGAPDPSLPRPSGGEALGLSCWGDGGGFAPGCGLGRGRAAELQCSGRSASSQRSSARAPGCSAAAHSSGTARAGSRE